MEPDWNDECKCFESPFAYLFNMTIVYSVFGAFLCVSLMPTCIYALVEHSKMSWVAILLAACGLPVGPVLLILDAEAYRTYCLVPGKAAVLWDETNPAGERNRVRIQNWLHVHAPKIVARCRKSSVAY